MKPKPTHEVERCRIITGPQASTIGYGNNGAFRIKTKDGVMLHVIVSDGMGWEHVSISCVGRDRCPTWDEMCFVKSLFWGPEETVIQYHPAESEYVRCHPYALHLWRPINTELPKPPTILVGPKN